ncbi:hypothetical protein [Parasitella parasitica]|uniref:Rhamnogalacturonan lyase domain-containing protein n=1 Tax=Parasitella parasitica TaxID=35722 RepID=A0A0B7NRV8_9FUNG|nr:hypothetical protein [Parasitella parasitica]
MAAFAMVLADQIFIYGPPANGVYHAKDVMDIRYQVRFNGMTKIWRTSATLVHDATNTTVAAFPSVKWSAYSKRNSAHKTWTIPSGLPDGNYTLSINANVTRLCSTNSDGNAPFTQCPTTLSEHRSFVISNSTQNDF